MSSSGSSPTVLADGQYCLAWWAGPCTPVANAAASRARARARCRHRRAALPARGRGPPAGYLAGVSNVLAADRATVSLTGGVLLAVQPG
jgi:hypothetical protein